jgi:hypothetical protein
MRTAKGTIEADTINATNPLINNTEAVVGAYFNCHRVQVIPIDSRSMQFYYRQR